MNHARTPPGHRQGEVAPPAPLGRGARARVLLCRPDHVGDVLLALPAAALLRTALPDAHLAFAASPATAGLVSRCPYVDDVLALPFPAPNAPAASARWEQVVDTVAPLLAGQYDVALLLRPDDPWSGALVSRAGVPVRVGFDQPRTAPHLTDVLRERKDLHVADQGRVLGAAALALLGHDAPPVRSERCLQLTLEDMAEADSGVRVTGAAPIVLHPGSGWTLKNWPASRWAELAVALHARHRITSLVLGSPDDAAVVAAVVDASRGAAVAGAQLSLPGVAALHARSRLVITTDSGAAHLAAMMGAAVVALYGPGDPVSYRPPCPPGRLRVVRVGLDCSPCGTLEHPPCGAVINPACITGISVASVLAAVDDLLERVPGPASGDELSGGGDVCRE